MRVLGLLLAMAGALAGAACTYGPPEDHGHIKSAALLADGRIAFSYHDLRYRPATGLAAFPDGGVPRYLVDRHVVAMVEPGGRTVEIARFPAGGLPGSGSVSVRWSPDDPAHLMLHRDAQQTTSLPLRHLSEFLRVRLDGSVVDRFDLRAELARKGRELGAKGFGDVRPLGPDGTLLVGATRDGTTELWRRDAAGLTLIDRFERFEGRSSGRIAYVRDGRVVIADARTGESRETGWQDAELQAMYPPGRIEPAVSVSGGGAALAVYRGGEREAEIKPDLAALRADD